MLKKIILTALLSISFSCQTSYSEKLALLEHVTHIKPIQTLIAGYLDWFYECTKIPVINPIHMLAYAPNAVHVAGLSYIDGTIRIWDAHTFRLIRALYMGHRNTHIGYSAHSDFLFGAQFSGITKYVVNKNYDAHMYYKFPGTTAIVHSTSGILAHITPREINIINIEKARAFIDCLEPARRHNILCAALKPDGSQLAVGSLDYIVELYDNLPETIKRTSINFENSISCLAYSNNGKYLAIGSDSPRGKITLWSTEKFVPQHPRALHAPAVYALTFSHDNKYLAVGSYNEITIWDVDSLELLNTLEGHTDTVCSLAFAPDGTKLISVSCDKTLRIWKKF